MTLENGAEYEFWSYSQAEPGTSLFASHTAKPCRSYEVEPRNQKIRTYPIESVRWKEARA